MCAISSSLAPCTAQHRHETRRNRMRHAIILPHEIRRIQLRPASFMRAISSSLAPCTTQQGTRHDALTWDMTHSCVPFPVSKYTAQYRTRHNSFICDMTHSRETWLIHVCHFQPPRILRNTGRDTTHSYETRLIQMRENSFLWDIT